MTEFVLSAFARYRDDSTGDAFAETSAMSPQACFAAMAREVCRWLPPARHAEGGEVPEAIELLLSWGGGEEGPRALAVPLSPCDRGEAGLRSQVSGEAVGGPTASPCVVSRPPAQTCTQRAAPGHGASSARGRRRVPGKLARLRPGAPVGRRALREGA